MTDDVSKNQKKLKADEVWNRWVEEEKEAKKMAIEERTKNRLKVNDPENKEAFLSWLKNRIESNGFTIENAPEYMGKAYKSGNPKDLNQLIWQEWYEFNNPNDVADSLSRGARYIERVSKNGNRYRQYY